MKTLKKNLCLVLAMVMVFGLCTISASAKLDYADNDAITYEEAVDVLSGLGILQGSASGFRPTASISRAEAAKIIAYIMIGDSTQADALKASSDPFTDVPASHWAAGYIAYCNSRGLILGVGDGSYRPNSTVTGLQFSTMLLRALGYGKNNEYSGADWSVKAASDAIRLGVFDDNLAGATEKPATREECALYAFNVVARLRDAGNNAKREGLLKVTYSSLAGDYVANGAFSGTGTGISVDANKRATFAADFGLKYRQSGDDDFERMIGHCWTQTVGNITKVITDEYKDAGDQIALYTAGVTGSDLYNLLVDSFGKGVYDDWQTNGGTLTIYHNGASATVATTNDTAGKTDGFNKGNIVKGATDTLKGTGKGIETYVYADINSVSGKLIDVRVCTVEYYLAKVEKVVAAKADADAETKVKVATLTGAGTGAPSGSIVYKTEDDLGFEKDDYVLITYAKSKIQSMEPVRVVENNISRFTNDDGKVSITAGGNVYVPAAVTAADGDLKSAAASNTTYINKELVNGKTHRVYVDKYGYMVSVADVTASSVYVYVSHFGPMTDHSSDFDGANIGAKVYYVDGTSAVLAVKSMNTTGTAYALKNASGSITEDGGSDAEALPGIYKLTMDGSKAVLEAQDSSTTNGDTVKPSLSTPVDVTKGIVAVDSTRTADNKTVFFYVKTPSDVAANIKANKWDDSGFIVTAYTGINSVPNTDKATAGKTTAVEALVEVANGSAGTVAKAVLVQDKLDGDAKDTVYIYDNWYEVDENNWTVTYKVYVNGQPDTLVIPYGTEAKKNTGVGDITATAGSFFTLNGSNVPVKITATKEYDKFKYTPADTLASITEYQFDLTSTTGPYPMVDATIINMTGEKLGSPEEINQWVSDGGTITKINVALQFSDAGRYLYITSVTP